MIRVKIYTPDLKRVKKKGEKNTTTIITNKKGRFVSERAIMSTTFSHFNDLEEDQQNEWIINNKMFFEVVDMSPEGLSKKSKEDLSDLAQKAGIKDVNNTDKKTIVEKISAFFSSSNEEKEEEQQ